MSSEKFRPSYLHPKFWLSWLVVGLSWTLARLPLSWQRSLSRWLGRKLANTHNSRIRIIRRNIELCFPEESHESKQTLVERNLESSLRMTFDLLNLIWRPPEVLTDPVRVVGEEHLKQALSMNKPLILVTGHFTTLFSYIGKLASINPFDAVYRRLDNPLLEAHLYQRGIAKYPINTFHRKDIRDMLVKLEDKGVVAIVPDQDFGLKRGEFVSFFDIPTATITSIPQYAQQTGAQVLLLSAYREGNNCVLEIEPLLENYPSGDDLADTQIWSDWLERKIREHPADYLWMHKRFKTRPEGHASFYKNI